MLKYGISLANFRKTETINYFVCFTPPPKKKKIILSLQKQLVGISWQKKIAKNKQLHIFIPCHHNLKEKAKIID